MDLIFLFIILLFVIMFIMTDETNGGGGVEKFADTPAKIGDMTMNALEEKIYQIYKADVLAIKNLADTATKLQAGGITVPGMLTVSGGCQLNGSDGNVASSIILNNTVNMKRKDGAYSHFDWVDGKNYLRGYTIIDNGVYIGNETTIDADCKIVRLATMTGGATIKNGLTVDNVTFASLAKRIKDLEDANFVSYNDKLYIYNTLYGILTTCGHGCGGGVTAVHGGSNGDALNGTYQLRTKII